MSIVSKNIDLVRSAVQDAVVMATGVKHIRVANIHVMYSFKITQILTLCSIVPVDLTQQTRDVRMTSDRRRSHRRRYDVIMSSCARWVYLRSILVSLGNHARETPLLYSKTWVCRGIPIFLIFALKHRLWVIV